MSSKVTKGSPENPDGGERQGNSKAKSKDEHKEEDGVGRLNTVEWTAPTETVSPCPLKHQLDDGPVPLDHVSLSGASLIS